MGTRICAQMRSLSEEDRMRLLPGEMRVLLSRGGWRERTIGPWPGFPGLILKVSSSRRSEAGVWGSCLVHAQYCAMHSHVFLIDPSVALPPDCSADGDVLFIQDHPLPQMDGVTCQGEKLIDDLPVLGLPQVQDVL